MTDIITLDFETYFGWEYTLNRKLTTEEYIRDPRFEVHGCGIRWPDGQYSWHDGNAFVAEISKRLDFSRTACLSHHAHFEGLILSHYFGLAPGLWIDTLPMARLLLGNHVKIGLDKLATHFNLPNKTVPYDEFRGLHWWQMSPDLRRRVAEGCLHDCGLTWSIFSTLAREFPASEYGVVDATIRMFSEPAIIGDTQMFADVWADEIEATNKLLRELNCTADALRSNEVFAEMLRAIGIDPEYKAGKNGPIYAFAKSDDFMRGLQEDGDDDARLLCDARIRAQSTNSQTRAERLGWMSTRGAMCVYINPYGAHTTRDSGGDKVNYQNFKRSSAEDPKRGRIRKAHGAPRGTKIGVVDASQIECRMLNEFAGQHDIVQKFREKRDVYSETAAIHYQQPVYKAKEGDPRKLEMDCMRGMGKQLELSCGYGAGGLTIQITAKKGTYGPPVYLTIQEAEAAKLTYRSTHARVEDCWKYANEVIKAMTRGDCDFWWNCLHVVCSNATGRKRIVLPNGCELIYDTLEWHVPTEEECLKLKNEWDHRGFFRLKTRKGWVSVYGAKLIENVIQALARVHLMTVMLRIRAQGIKIWMRCHDELAVLIPDNEFAQGWIEWCAEQMKIPPPWMPNVPLDAEFMLGDRYEK